MSRLPERLQFDHPRDGTLYGDLVSLQRFFKNFRVPMQTLGVVLDVFRIRLEVLGLLLKASRPLLGVL